MMDMKLFLEGQTKWEDDSPHRLVMLYEMFKHATDQGQKEVERTVSKGCWQGLPKLDQEVDLSAIQLVSPKTTKEEILSLYLEVYKQQRLPGSLPGELELTKEVVSTFEGHQRWKEERTPGVTMRPQSINAQPSKSRVPGKRETSIEKSLAPIREAHQKALATAAALEGEIERLSCPLPQSWPEVRTRLKSRDCWMHGATESKRRHCQVHFTNSPTPYHLPRDSPESGKGKPTLEDSDLGELLELEPGVTSFLRGSEESLEEEGPPHELPLGEFQEWVTWKAEMTKTPDWWRELLVVPGVPNCKRLAQKVQALFSHPKRASEVKEAKYCCQVPLPHQASLEGVSSHLQILSSLVEISERYRGRRP